EFPGFPGGFAGHTVEPIANCLFQYETTSLANEDQEGRLECVLGIVVVVQEAAAHPPDHRAVPTHEGTKRSIITAAEECLQQLLVGQAFAIAQKHFPQLVDDATH